jgi:hypothetical protein
MVQCTGGDQVQNLAADEPRSDSCSYHRDSCLDRLDSVQGKVNIAAVDKLRPVNYSGHHIELATVESDELAGDRRLTALCHVSRHIRRVTVTRYNRLIIAGESCHD